MTEQPSAESTWIALLDVRQGRLVEASLTERGGIHLEEHDRIEESWEEHEHLRIAPSISPDRGSHADWRRQDTERVRRFAREAVTWLQHASSDRKIERLTVLCSPKLLGQVRQELPGPLEQKLDLLRGDFAHVPLPDLATHPVITQIVSGAHDAD